MDGFDIAAFSRKDGSIAPEESSSTRSAPVLEPFWEHFTDSGNSFCVFGLYANARPAKKSRRRHGGYSGHECPDSPELWLYRDIYTLTLGEPVRCTLFCFAMHASSVSQLSSTLLSILHWVRHGNFLSDRVSAGLPLHSTPHFIG